MRIITFFLLFISVFVTAQKRDVPVINFPNTSESINPYVKLLGLKDDNALILRATMYSYNSILRGSYLVLTSSGKLYHYAAYLNYSDTLVLHTPAAKKDRRKLIKLFKTPFDLYPIEINKNSEFSIMQPFISKLGVYQKNNYFEYEVYEYSQDDEMISKYEKLMEFQRTIDYEQYIKTSDIDEVKKLDTIYVHFTHDKMQKLEMPGNTNEYPSSYMFYHLDSAYDLFYELREKRYQETIINVKRSFIRKHKDAIVDYNFFTKYCRQLDFLRKKVVYIIDDNGKRLFLKKVKYTPIYFSG